MIRETKKRGGGRCEVVGGFFGAGAKGKNEKPKCIEKRVKIYEEGAHGSTCIHPEPGPTFPLYSPDIGS